jgi:hypothetical protein
MNNVTFKKHIENLAKTAKVHHESIHVKTLRKGSRTEGSWFIAGVRCFSSEEDIINEMFVIFLTKKVAS